MHRALTARWLNRALSIGETTPSAGVPLFLCPAVGYGRRVVQKPFVSARSTICARRLNHTEAITTTTNDAPTPTPPPTTTIGQGEVPTRRLPLTCTGCGSFVQTNDPQQFGYYDLESKRVKKWMHPQNYEPKRMEREADHLVDEVLKKLDPSKLEELGLSASALVSGEESGGTDVPSPVQEKQPVCERCHNLQHYNTSSDTAKITMYHPTVESLRETIEESPHKYNHIYHVIDAADFPMSLIPRLNVLLGDIPLRTKNRRSRSGKYIKDRKTELSFIITRGDLLGPTKEIVDSMMPYLREVLRDSLGRLGGRVRLGNLRCVSAKRSWWTKDVREDIWQRGGAGWMVGKVNVGKSQLFEAVYPKGRMGVDKGGLRGVSTYPRGANAESITAKLSAEPEDWENVNVGDLLPPIQPAKNYPEMPLVSSLPGTTASPIRVPFGNGKGELIDLPGLARSDLDLFIKEEHRQAIIMKKRIIPEQISVKPGKSLILGGGLIRITPKTPDMVFLMYNFTPLGEHLTQTEKAIAFQDQSRRSIALENITLDGIGDKMKHAGTFKLDGDVTKTRAGPLTRKNAVGLQVDRLPFRVVSTDILIEGVGYVEIVAQVRARDLDVRPPRALTPRPVVRQPEPVNSDPFAAMKVNRRDSNETKRKEIVETKRRNTRETILEELDVPTGPEPNWPEIDVFSPEGRFIGSRKPINGWLNNKPRVLAEHKRSRPRRSMKGQKKMAKVERRAAES
ncbi:Fc.00g014660.m01.CDS01 [Cosmosporella sp. VM-42]